MKSQKPKPLFPKNENKSIPMDSSEEKPDRLGNLKGMKKGVNMGNMKHKAWRDQ